GRQAGSAPRIRSRVGHDPVRIPCPVQDRSHIRDRADEPAGGEPDGQRGYTRLPAVLTPRVVGDRGRALRAADDDRRGGWRRKKSRRSTRITREPWELNDAIIRSRYHCDPNELTLPQYWSLLDYLIDLYEMENG